MRLRSTGLGRTELEAELVSVKKVDDLVIFFVNTTQPVKWRTRILKLLKPRNLWFVLKALISPNKQVPKEDF
jgi:hypothetical protein